MATNINSAFVNKVIKHYLRYDKDNPFIFISSIMAFLSIAVGIAVLMIAMGMMNGTENEVKKRLFQMVQNNVQTPQHPHIQSPSTL